MFSCLPFLGALCGNCGNRCKNSRFKQKSGQNTTGDYLIYEKFWDQTFKRPPEKIEYTENTEIGQKLHQTAAKRQTFSRNGSKLDQNHRKVLKVFEQFIGVPFNFFLLQRSFHVFCFFRDFSLIPPNLLTFSMNLQSRRWYQNHKSAGWWDIHDRYQLCAQKYAAECWRNRHRRWWWLGKVRISPIIHWNWEIWRLDSCKLSLDPTNLSIFPVKKWKFSSD